jgi:hypothetical protein
MTWGTFDRTTEMILSVPTNALAASINISAAYHMMPVAPAQQNAVCVYWDGLVYIDCAVMFGLSSSTGVFGCIVDMLAAIYQKARFGPLLKWVDDFFII